MMRNPGVFDRFLCEVDTALRALCVPQKRSSVRENPAAARPEALMSPEEKRHVAGLMRVNHAGEVCAQALYQGQALTAQLTSVKDQMTQAAAEEIEHLAWCEERLRELGSQPSVLNPFWYGGSFLIGAIAGLVGDRWSLGFVAETEHQVTAHIARHLEQVPAHDEKTKAVLLQMKADETAHAESAVSAGGAELPALIKRLMYGMSTLLTASSKHI